MFVQTLRSEWIKLTTTKAFWWTTALFMVFSIGFAALLTLSTKALASNSGMEGGFADTSTSTMALYSIGFTILIVQAAMVFTSEYRNSTASVTFTATPKRYLVLIAKVVLYAVIAAAVTFVTILACFYISKAIAGSPIQGTKAFSPFEDERAKRVMWLYPMAIAGLVVLTQGVSILVRQTAGAVAIMLVWFLALENLIALLPRIGAKIARFGPMTNLDAFDKQRDLADFLPWQSSVWVFWAWAVGIFIIGVLVASKRDV